jgi:hypothetical protein
MNTEYEVRWLRHGEEKPDGWEYAHNEHRMRDHHAHYARMIVREIQPTERDDAERRRT